MDPVGPLQQVGASRLDRLRKLVGDIGPADRILITEKDDIRWLCGFTGSNGWLIVGESHATLLTDSRYTEQARIEAASLGLELEIAEQGVSHSLAEVVAEVIPARSRHRILFAPRHLSVADYRSLESSVGECLEPLGESVSQLRRFKDQWEVDVISRAASIADAALSETLGMLSSGVLERDVRDELEYRMRRHGADAPSYDTIVASGPVNSAKPHHSPESRMIREGDAVVIDVGALVDGYHSDMTRTFFIGDPDPELLRLYAIVREAQDAAVSAVAPGVLCSEIDRIGRKVLADHAVEDLFIHGTGHGVGLAIHENPYIGRQSTSTLEVGDVVTVEPGLYRMGVGGVRIEDLLVVTESAHRCLTSLPKDSPCLPSPQTI